MTSWFVSVGCLLVGAGLLALSARLGSAIGRVGKPSKYWTAEDAQAVQETAIRLWTLRWRVSGAVCIGVGLFFAASAIAR